MRPTSWRRCPRQPRTQRIRHQERAAQWRRDRLLAPRPSRPLNRQSQRDIVLRNQRCSIQMLPVIRASAFWPKSRVSVRSRKQPSGPIASSTPRQLWWRLTPNRSKIIFNGSSPRSRAALADRQTAKGPPAKVDQAERAADRQKRTEPSRAAPAARPRAPSLRHAAALPDLRPHALRRASSAFYATARARPQGQRRVHRAPLPRPSSRGPSLWRRGGLVDGSGHQLSIRGAPVVAQNPSAARVTTRSNRRPLALV